MAGSFLRSLARQGREAMASLASAARQERVRGTPPSGNGASSLHLHWLDAPPAMEAEVTVEVVEPPAVARLYFWALQASFQPGGGGAHTGLQWNPRHATGRAVNWGGYGWDGSILKGTESSIPSSVADPNTRTWLWEDARPYRLRIRPGSSSGWWRADVTDLETGERTPIRELEGGGDHLGGLMVWSEVFARCDDEPVRVRWSDPSVIDRAGDRHAVERYRVAYQAFGRGGCTNTQVEPGPGHVDQVTATSRTVPAGTVVPAG